MKTHDFLADKMHVCRPVTMEFAIIISKVIEGGKVIAQGIEPYIDNMIGIKRYRYPPPFKAVRDIQRSSNPPGSRKLLIISFFVREVG